MKSKAKPIVFFSFLALGGFLSGFSIFSVPQTIPLESVPVRAEIILDGKSLGKTPIKLFLERTQSHKLTLKAEGYKAFVVELKPVFKERPSRSKSPRKRYARLMPETIKAELIPEFIPDYPGPYAYKELSALVAKVEKLLKDKAIDKSQHDYMLKKIFEIYGPDKN